MKHFLFFCLFLFSMYGCQISSGDAYTRKVNEKRLEETLFLKTDPRSPLPIDDRRSFVTLRYFDPDISWRLVADWQALDSPYIVQLTTNEGRLVSVLKAGILHFQKDGRDFSLIAYQKPEEVPYDSTHLWIPFTDSTTGFETWEGGRQLIVHFNSSDTLTLDFNYASNPYPAYDKRFKAPYAPEENALPIAIEAGEKKYIE